MNTSNVYKTFKQAQNLQAQTQRLHQTTMEPLYDSRVEIASLT